MKNTLIQALLRGILIAAALVTVNVTAQVSNVEGLAPLNGVSIPKSNKQQAIKPGAVFKDCDDCPEMVVIPAGSFMMGSPSELGENDEKPQHRVNIQSFAIGKYEVSQKHWFAVMGNNPSSKKGQTLPVENISWHDAQLFVQKLSQKTGKKYRLPSEAEWEYAARAGTTTDYFWGGDQADNYAWFSNNSGITPHPLGSKKPNQFGLYDMMGNVWEWTQDCYHSDYSGAPIDGSAWTDENCYQRVSRGGSTDLILRFLRTASRLRSNTADQYGGSGFRVVREL